MTNVRRVGIAAAALLCSLLPSAVQAQQSLSGLAGAVRNAAGQPVAGVTVEAASPALIERTRAVTTDGAGQYKITDLQPGEYTLTFRGMGFSTLVNTGIELRASFQATINASLKAGNPSEVVTVAASALSDTRSSTQAATMTQEESRTLASGTNAQAAVSVTRGLTSTNTDVGGTAGSYVAQGNGLTVRGKAGVKRLFDGLRVENAEGLGSTSYMVNNATVSTTVVETGGGSGESLSAGGSLNYVPQSGSNTFAYRLSGLISTEGMQADNLDDGLRARGLTGVQKVSNIYDATFTVGGPIKKDKLWFFFAPKYWGNQNYAAGIYYQATHTPVASLPFGYTPDFSKRGDQLEVSRSQPVRLTWQANAKNKFNFFVDWPEAACTCRALPTTGTPESLSANYIFGRRDHLWQIGLFQATWSSARSSKLLLEAGASFAQGGWPNVHQPGVSRNDIAIQDSGLGFNWNDGAALHAGIRGDLNHVSDRLSERFTASYVTGSHAYKVGIASEHVWHGAANYINLDKNGFPVTYQYRNAAPTGLTEWSAPYVDMSRVRADLGIFAQDQWTLNKLTVNYGVRYSYFNGGVPEQQAPPTAFVPFARNANAYDAVTNPGGGYSAKTCVPCWNDIDPRFGAAYDVFGNGKTVVKGSIGRYVSTQVVALATQNNPFNTAINSVTRSWADANGNFTPDCDLSNAAKNGECGPISNTSFGQQNQNATTYDSSVIGGFGNRNYVWDSSIELQHQLTPRISLTGGYYRNWAANFQVTDNQFALAGGGTVGPSSYDLYCVTVPTGGAAPISGFQQGLASSFGFANGGVGSQYCGLADVNAAAFGKQKNVVSNDQSRGFNQTAVNDFFGVSANMRLPRNARVNVNIDTGRTVTDSCFVLDSPAQATYDVQTRSTTTFNYCHGEIPFSANTSIRINGTLPIVYGIQLSANYQNSPGAAVTALWTAPNSVIAAGVTGLPTCGGAVTTNCNLGRALSGSASTAPVTLIPQGAVYEARRNQVDLRFQKTQKISRKATLTGTLGIYNILNANDVLSINNAYGSNWLRPTRVMDPRLFQVAARLDF